MTKRIGLKFKVCLNQVVFMAFCFFVLNTSFADTANSAEISVALKSIQDKYDVAAAGVLIVSKDKVLLNLHQGLKERTTKQPFSDQNMYRIGSISKSFGGILALRLQQQGLINLTDSIGSYGLTPYLENNFPKHAITLAHLLEHTAGLSDLAEAEWDYNDSKPINLKEAFELNLGEHKTQWAPGMYRSYSNVGPGLFGLALELKLGQSYESLMQQHVFDPLKMAGSGLLLTPEVKQRLITGYDRDGRKPIKYWHNIYRPFAAINSHSPDMINWLQMLLKQDSSFLSQTHWQRLVTPTTTLAARNGLSYGYGLGVYQWQTNGISFFGHGGDADGYLTRFGFNPESGLAYFVMITAFNHQPLNQIVALLEQQITNDLPKPEYPPRLVLSEKLLSQYAGNYQSLTQRFSRSSHQEIKVQVMGDQLTLEQKNRQKVTLYAVTKNQFRTVNESTATHIFTTEKGQQYLLGKSGNYSKVN